MSNSENTITTAFVNVLRPMRQAWSVNEQITKPFLNATKKPDVIVTEVGRNPIVIKVKIDGDTPNLSGKTQAEAHFGRLLDANVVPYLTYNTVAHVMRIRMPARFKTMPQDTIEPEMRKAEDIAYLLLSQPKPVGTSASESALFINEAAPESVAAPEQTLCVKEGELPPPFTYV